MNETNVRGCVDLGGESRAGLGSGKRGEGQLRVSKGLVDEGEKKAVRVWTKQEGNRGKGGRGKGYTNNNDNGSSFNRKLRGAVVKVILTITNLRIKCHSGND